MSISTNGYQRTNYILLNIQVVTAILGILGNLLVIAVFRRKRLKNASYSIYFRVMVSIEILVLLHSFRHWARHFLNFDLNNLSSFFCKINEFHAHVAGFSSTWLLTIILIDRYFTVVYNNKFAIFKRRWFQLTLISTVILYSIALHSTMPMSYQLGEVSFSSNNTSSLHFAKTYVCYMNDQKSKYLYVVFLANHSVHLGINFVLHVKLIWFIFESRRKILTRTNLLLVRDLKFAISSIALTITTFFCRLPFVIWLLSTNLNLSHDQKQIIFTTGITVVVISHGASFFVNMMFNSIFYEEFLTMLRPRSKSVSSMRT